MSDYSELWQKFERHGAERFETFTAWAEGGNLPGRLGQYYADRAAGSWWENAFRTFKAMRARGIEFMAKPLAFPEARTVGDLFEAARFLCPETSGLYRDEAIRKLAGVAGGPGFLYAGGSRAEGAAPARSIYARREWAEAGHRRAAGAGGFWATYAKPRREVLKAWGDEMGVDSGDFGLSGFELVTRSDGAGVLVIGRTYCGIGERWLAFLDPGATLLDLMPPEDRRKIEREAFLDHAAWGGHAQRPEGLQAWTVKGEDRAEGAQGTPEPFAVTVQAASAEAAGAQAVSARYAVGREHVSITYRSAALPRVVAASSGEALARAGVAIDSDVLEVLKAAVTDGPRLVLLGQLERGLYQRADKVLATLGAKWTGGKTRAHVFEGDAGEILGAVLASGRYVDARKVLQAFYTPPDLAARVVDAAKIAPGMTCLEPSAGKGALAIEARSRGALVTCMDLDEAARDHLESKGFTCALGDFLAELPDEFDRVVMNPPFSNGQDVRHVLHASQFVRPGGRLVAIMSPGFRFRSTEPFVSFRAWLDEHGAEVTDIPAGAFAQSGTNVATVLVCVDL